MTSGEIDNQNELSPEPGSETPEQATVAPGVLSCVNRRAQDVADIV